MIAHCGSTVHFLVGFLIEDEMQLSLHDPCLTGIMAYSLTKFSLLRGNKLYCPCPCIEMINLEMMEAGSMTLHYGAP